jgi:hypothetical protein
MAILPLLRSKTAEDRFAERVIRRLREMGWPHRLAYDPASFAIEVGEPVGVFNLANIYRDWLEAPPSARPQHLDRSVSFLFETPLNATYEDVAAQILPAVRNLSHLQSTVLDAKGESTQIWQPFRTIADAFGAVLVVDMPTSTMLLPTGDFERWGLGFDEVFDHALANLVRKSPVRFKASGDGFLISDYGDAFDSSRLLMPELFHALQLPGAPVAIPISPSRVVVAGSDEIEALCAMAAFAEKEVPLQTRPTGCMPLRLDGDTWVPFLPEGSALFPLRKLALAHRHWDYSLQTPYLEAYLLDRGEDVHVPPLEMLSNDKQAWTWTSWAQNVPVRLPRADWVGLALTENQEMIPGSHLIRRWEDIEAVCGPFVEDRSLHPRRYTPPAWPSDEQWRRLSKDYPTAPWDEEDMAGD